MKTEERENFIKEANREAAREYVNENHKKMTESEIITHLIDGGFKEAEAWENADELKNKSEN